MFSTTLTVIAIMITLPIIILLWATESPEQRLTRRVKWHHKCGLSQRQIAAELGISRYRVRLILA